MPTATNIDAVATTTALKSALRTRGIPAQANLINIRSKRTCSMRFECPLSGVKRKLANRCVPASFYEYTRPAKNRGIFKPYWLTGRLGSPS